MKKILFIHPDITLILGVQSGVKQQYSIIPHMQIDTVNERLASNKFDYLLIYAQWIERKEIVDFISKIPHGLVSDEPTKLAEKYKNQCIIDCSLNTSATKQLLHALSAAFR